MQTQLLTGLKSGWVCIQYLPNQEYARIHLKVSASTNRFTDINFEMISLFPVSCCVRSGNNWAALDSHAQLPAGGACRNGANIAVEVRLQSRILCSNTVHETLTIGSISLDSSMIMSCALRRGLQDCKLQPSAGWLAWPNPWNGHFVDARVHTDARALGFPDICLDIKVPQS